MEGHVPGVEAQGANLGALGLCRTFPSAGGASPGTLHSCCLPPSPPWLWRETRAVCAAWTGAAA